MALVSTRRESSFRPYFLSNGNVVENIIFYAGGKVLYESSRGWLSDNQEGYDITGMRLKTEPKRAIKVNLGRDDNYYIKGGGEYRSEEHTSELQSH